MTAPGAMRHGALVEVFANVFMVTGTMRGEFFGSTWQFSRNMTVVREDGKLSLINAVRLDEDGLKALEALGTVTNVVRIGPMHGYDDTFYVNHYSASYWITKGCPNDKGLPVAHEMEEGGTLPFSNSSLFVFNTTKAPESVIILEHPTAGGIAIACDALQNYVAPDEYFDVSTTETMRGMGFFAPANCGPAWVQMMEPKADDFKRFKAQVKFKHALCGHGEPLKDTALEQYHATFKRMFGVE
eukprot:TRINITY_DN17266_c0_g1_i1.p1 TRINITY_DN17266_c0_g1~~TRINITY_DN17266_c0_g1_i1.p1  ORF type:complete len:263 (+),score=46.88 TRINITY_DN17266_c0_g1_i1:65-790(+)